MRIDRRMLEFLEKKDREYLLSPLHGQESVWALILPVLGQ